MTRHLCISATLLDGLFHGTRDFGEPEWPPSPLRLFQALLAGSRTGCRNLEWSDAKADAFRWLERNDPPEILAPEARLAASCTLFVPNNDTDVLAADWAKGKEPRKSAADLRTAKLLRPHRLLDGQAIHYLWAINEDRWQQGGSRAVEALCREARHILAFGWGLDQAVGDGRVLTARQVASLPGVRWRPWGACRAPGSAARRVPRPGALDDLLGVYDSFLASVRGRLYRPPRKPSVFDTVAYCRLGSPPPRPFAAFELRTPQGAWRPFPQVEAVCVAAMLRHAACQAAMKDSHQFPGGPEQYVAGHVPDSDESPPRFSYLPLPTVGHPHADGMIRRALVAEPLGQQGDQAEWARLRLRNRTLTDDANRPQAMLTLAEENDRVVSAYTEPAQSWSTVTPVVLPGFDDGDQRKAERLFFKAVRQAGLPIEAVADLTLRKAPFWPGSQHPRLYRRPDYLKHLPAWHAHLRFVEPVSGPMSIGAGRHCGLGILAAEDHP